MAIPAAVAAVGAKVAPALKTLGSNLSLSSLKNLGGTIGSKLSSAFNTLGTGGVLDGILGAGTNLTNNKALDDYVNTLSSDMAQSLEKRAEKYDQKLQNQFNEAEPQYQAEANTQLPELTQLIEDIANQSAEAQRQNQRQINASLAQQGVRGGQASILANRATGELNRDLQRDINQTAYNEAANRQNSRLNYYGQKALTPWSTMSQAYGSSLSGANNALSNAQGKTLENAYNAALQNRSKGLLGNLVAFILTGINVITFDIFYLIVVLFNNQSLS